MKLKYYLRGLATGLVVATLILTIANRDNKPLTDAQVRQRAAELGMVDGDSLKLSALQSNTTESSSQPESCTSESSSQPESGTTESSSQPESGTTESSSQPESGTSESSSQPESGMAESSSRPESGAAESSSQAGSDSTQEPGPEKSTVTITIIGGDTSYTVSKDLAAAGLVEDAKVYDTYLCDNGYASRIRVGVYEIEPGTSGEEIAKMIAH